MGSPTEKPCTALMKYEPLQWLRAHSVAVKGHCFLREANWLCSCGMHWPRGSLPSEIQECTALPN